MNPSAQKIYANNDSLSFRLHEQARRHRSRMIAGLVARQAAKLSLSVPAQLQIARWG